MSWPLGRSTGRPAQSRRNLAQRWHSRKTSWCSLSGTRQLYSNRLLFLDKLRIEVGLQTDFCPLFRNCFSSLLTFSFSYLTWCKLLEHDMVNSKFKNYRFLQNQDQTSDYERLAHTPRAQDRCPFGASSSNQWASRRLSASQDPVPEVIYGSLQQVQPFFIPKIHSLVKFSFYS